MTTRHCKFSVASELVLFSCDADGNRTRKNTGVKIPVATANGHRALVIYF